MAKGLIKIIVIIVFLAVVGIAVYNIVLFVTTSGVAPVNVAQNIQKNNAQSKTPVKEVPKITPEQQTAEVNKDYPLVIDGVINFLDKGANFKTTIKSDDGKIYILWPPQPSPVYQTFGVKNGGRVEVQGRINAQGNLEFGLLKPI